jgi:hypothetical protein
MTLWMEDISAEQLFDAKCGICHTKTRPTDMSKEWMYDNFPPAGFKGHGRGKMRGGM